MTDFTSKELIVQDNWNTIHETGILAPFTCEKEFVPEGFDDELVFILSFSAMILVIVQPSSDKLVQKVHQLRKCPKFQNDSKQTE